jgi:hypothetical protein
MKKLLILLVVGLGCGSEHGSAEEGEIVAGRMTSGVWHMIWRDGACGGHLLLEGGPALLSGLFLCDGPATPGPERVEGTVSGTQEGNRLTLDFVGWPDPVRMDGTVAEDITGTLSGGQTGAFRAIR